MDAKTKHQITDEGRYVRNTPSPHAQYYEPSPAPHNTKWLAPPGPHPSLRRNRRVDVVIDTMNLLMQGEVARYNEEKVAVS